VKLLPTATATRETENEISILQHIQAQAEKSEHIRRFLGRFVESRGDRYDGIVLEVTGQSVQSKLSRDSISFLQKKKIVHDCICGVTFLHQYNVAHGDLYDRNICLGAWNFSQLDDAQVSKSVGIPICVRVKSLSNEPIDSCLSAYTVREACFDCDGPTKLIDLGGAWRFGNWPQNTQVPSVCRPPELLQSPWQLVDDVGLDLWMLGCTIYRIFVNGSLFDEMDDARLLAQINSVLNDSHLTAKEVIVGRLSRDAPEIDDCDREQLAKIITSLIVSNPLDRTPARELQTADWLQVQHL